MNTAKLYAVLALALLLIGVVFFIFRQGGSAPRAEAKVAKTEVKMVTASVEVSKATAEKVDIQGAEVRQRAVTAKETIHEAIARDPAGVDPTADAAIVREAEQAYAAALRAACRVQRTSDCPSP